MELVRTPQTFATSLGCETIFNEPHHSHCSDLLECLAGEVIAEHFASELVVYVGRFVFLRIPEVDGVDERSKVVRDRSVTKTNLSLSSSSSSFAFVFVSAVGKTPQYVVLST